VERATRQGRKKKKRPTIAATKGGNLQNGREQEDTERGVKLKPKRPTKVRADWSRWRQKRDEKTKTSTGNKHNPTE